MPIADLLTNLKLGKNQNRTMQNPEENMHHSEFFPMTLSLKKNLCEQ